MQKTLVTIIGEHQSEAIKNIITLLYALFLFMIDELNKLNKNLSIISLELILSFLLRISTDMETNSFTYLKLYIQIPNVKLRQRASYLIF